VGVALAIVGYAIVLAFNPDNQLGTWVDDWGAFATSMAAFAAAAHRVRRSSGQHRSAWSWLAATTGFWVVGEAIWIWYLVFRNASPPSPGVADAIYLLVVPLAVVGIIQLGIGKDGARRGLRFALDGVVIAVSLLFVSWATSLGIIYRLSGGPLLARIVDISYPATDILMATTALAALSRTRVERRTPLALLGLGMVAFSVSDSAYSYFAYTNRYIAVLDVGYVIGYVLLACAAVVSNRDDPAETEPAPPGRSQLLLPYVPVAFAVATAVSKAVNGGRFDATLVGTGFVLLACVFVRQLITLLDNRRLAEQLQQTVSQLRSRETQLAYQASHDPLTGLANRVLFADRIDRALERQRRNETAVAVMVCDLDDFKTINDTLGHLVGDEVLRIVADTLSEAVRGTDTIARLGGDEFGVVLEDLESPATACEVAVRMTEALASPVTIAGHQVATSASIGIAIAGDPGESSESLQRAADLALYDVKANGKGTYSVFDAERLSTVFARMSLKQELIGLSERPQELELHYQPILDVHGEEVTGVEALLRWRHPRLGLLQPSAFIDAAEENGTIVSIGATVLDLACEQLVKWREEGLECPNISVNVSPLQLRDPSLVRIVRDTLFHYRIPASQLTLEVTESIMISQGERAIDRLKDLKELGVLVAVDDFGAGYSSIEYLRRLPIDVLKIDRSFTEKLEEDETTVALVDMISQLARALGLLTVIEGIETAEQLDVVRSLSCDRGQGFLLARPALPDQVAPLLSGPAVLSLGVAATAGA
jgi:diguanylate cyclase (GGDEF)-like protein